MQERRLARAEAELSGEQKVIAWLEQVRPIGYVDYGLRSMRRQLRPQLDLQDEQSVLLYRLIIECNRRTLALLEDAVVGRLVAVYLRRLWCTREQPFADGEAECVHQAVLDFVVAGQSLAGAVEQVAAQYLSGREILFCDSRKVLEEMKETAQTVLACYNTISEKTAFPTISQADLQSEIAEDTQKVVGAIEGLMQAEVQMEYGNSLAAARAMESIPVIKSLDPGSCWVQGFFSENAGEELHRGQEFTDK